MKLGKTVAIIAVVLSIGAVFWYLRGGVNGKTIQCETVPVEKGSIMRTVTATGTVQPITVVEVGTQISGVIKSILVDYNSIVKSGQILAELDKTTLATVLRQAEAKVIAAKTELDYQTKKLKRAQDLASKKMVSPEDFDLAEYNFATVQSNLITTKAEHEKAKINLEYATIKSPIDGIVISRAVNEGQTVAASFSTPTLFTIANDLTKMQVQASVDEADIGKSKPGKKLPLL